MVKYIFDLDFTLYSEHDFKDSKNENEYYDSFRKKTFLKQLLTKLKGQKFLLTNANLEHTSAVLEKIGLMNLFKDVISSDIVNSYKPYRLIYDVAIREFKIGEKEEILYFEDLEENLRTGKKIYNWTTVLISPTKVKKGKYVDYVFDTIENALLFFIVKNKFKNSKKDNTNTNTNKELKSIMI